MPTIDFSKVDDVQDFSPLPDGSYLCRVAEVEERQTQYGDEMWRVRFVVDADTHRGRAIFDNIVFSDAALGRAKLICSRLGLDVSGKLELTPSLIIGRRCHITVETEEYQDQDGNTKKRNVVPFAGYEHADSTLRMAPKPGPASEAEDDGEEGLPF